MTGAWAKTGFRPKEIKGNKRGQEIKVNKRGQTTVFRQTMNQWGGNLD